MMRTLVAGSLLLLAGCAGAAGGVPSAPPPAADACGAAALTRYLGAVPTPQVRSAIAAVAADRGVRYIAPGDAVTMDFRPDRLNVETGADGRIARVRCG